MAAISAFDMLKIGVGPSSSHTLGPWRAAQRAVEHWREVGIFDSVVALQVDLYGSLAKTGRGHMTDMAVMLGLSNEAVLRRWRLADFVDGQDVGVIEAGGGARVPGLG